MKTKKNALIRKTFIAEVLTDVEAKKLFETATKTYNCKIKGAPVDDSRTIFLKISTSDPDRSQDTVAPKGFDVTNFANNPVVSAFHDYTKPAVGRALELGIGDNYVVSKMEFPPEGINPEADILQGLYKSGFQHAASIGFIPKSWEPNDIGGKDFNEIELIEYALVLVPDNPGALQMMYQKGFNPETFHEDFYELKGVIGYKKTPLADKGTAWDGPAEVKKATVDDLRVMCAWVDSENADNKGAYKLPHHEADGEHAVVWNGVKAAGGAIQGAQGGVDIPEGDVAGVKAHLEKHYHEFDEKAPWEADKEDDGKSTKETETKEKKTEKAESEEPELPQGDEDNAADPGYAMDTQVTELTVGQLCDLIDRVLDAEQCENDDMGDGKSARPVVQKDVAEVIALSDILDCLSWYIWAFSQNDVSQSSVDKLNQALGLVLQVVQEQAVLGKKNFDFSTFKGNKESLKLIAKSGRAISGANQEKLTKALDHMQQSQVHVQDVLDSVNDQDDEDNGHDNDDDRNAENGKSTKPSLLKRLTEQKEMEKHMKVADKHIGLALRFVKHNRQQDDKSDGERS